MKQNLEKHTINTDSNVSFKIIFLIFYLIIVLLSIDEIKNIYRNKTYPLKISKICKVNELRECENINGAKIKLSVSKEIIEGNNYNIYYNVLTSHNHTCEIKNDPFELFKIVCISSPDINIEQEIIIKSICLQKNNEMYYQYFIIVLIFLYIIISFIVIITLDKKNNYQRII